jgi:hypothetical protein
MEPRDAAKALAAALKSPEKPLTIADAAEASGLALRDAERGLHFLTSEYRGHLRVTSEGDLLFLFPYGFTKPWETRDALARAASAVGRGVVGVGRFVVRAWVMIALLAYAALFLAIVIGMMFARQGDDDRRSNSSSGIGGELGFVFFRVIADALFWTFHPFSPFSYGYGYSSWGGRDEEWGSRRARRTEPRDKTPFYEKVNRFFFGPTPPPDDPRAMEKKIVAQIRSQKGRIGLADVMRVTGLPREEADPLMARLMLDYEGDVSVSEEGGITYQFEALRKTANEGASEPPPKPAWDKPKELPPLTGNDSGANMIIGGLNLFNLVMSLVAIEKNVTLAKLPYLFSRIPLAMLPDDGIPIVLGVVPLVFSIALFALPLGRALFRRRAARKVEHENGRLAMLRAILARIDAKEPVTDAALVQAYERATGRKPESKEVTREVVRLGGDAEIETGEVRYRFVDLETEAAALEAEREAAPEAEKKVGKVIFASDA